VRKERVNESLREVIAYYDAIAKEYDDSYRDDVSLYEYKVIRALLAKVLSGKTLIDLGCGTGLFFDLGFRPQHDAYLGIDVSPRMIEIAKGKYPEYQFAVSDIQTATRPFEVAIALNGVISCVRAEDLAFLRDWVTVGGSFLIMVYGKGEGLSTRRDRGSANDHALVVRRYSAKSIVGRLTAAGLVVDGVRGLNVCLPLGNRNSTLRWIGNFVLERMCPSAAELIIVWGHRPVL
jgi:SAM-dependent methyltransferase